ncbi:hypothetical protein D7M11_02080 [Paenibacillus ginsengarvi]|uniref:Uncharacterized protein n=1 Tax=Paenibacillus ginsengarvi TaxID=400777 RepID=A0A3B0CV95_9BACL|nr:hypothetical protein D7M11_02080 [Paenibacillus ginsengarvi]
MKYTEITKWEQINRLKKGDILLICWSKTSPIFRNTKKQIHMHKFIKITPGREVILSGSYNPYFGIKHYLLGNSAATKVALVETV